MEECEKTGFAGGESKMTKSMRLKEEMQASSVRDVRLKAAVGDEMFAFLAKENISSRARCVSLHLRERWERIVLCYSGCHRDKNIIFTQHPGNT